jgi:hypothetical protein
VGEVEVGVGKAAGVTPGARVNADGAQKCAQVQLARGAHGDRA